MNQEGQVIKQRLNCGLQESKRRNSETVSRATAAKSATGVRRRSGTWGGKRVSMASPSMMAAGWTDVPAPPPAHPERDATAGAALEAELDGLDVEERHRRDAQGKLGEISRRRSAVNKGDFVASDMCGRGDPRVFAEFSKRLSRVNGAALADGDLDAITEAARAAGAKQRRAPLRRSASQHARRSKAVYTSLVRLFRFNRAGVKSDH